MPFQSSFLKPALLYDTRAGPCTKTRLTELLVKAVYPSEKLGSSRLQYHHQLQYLLLLLTFMKPHLNLITVSLQAIIKQNRL